MARPRQFNEDDAVNAALMLFRTQGYKATSMSQLTQVMGLSRSSFYETFGNKQALFVTTLKRFDRTVAIYNFVEKSNVQAAKKVEDIFERIVTNVKRGAGGCLYGNCAIEFINNDSVISKQIQAGVDKLAIMFEDIIIEGQQNDDVSKDLETEPNASALVATFYGLQVMAKVGVEQKKIKQVIKQALRELN